MKFYYVLFFAVIFCGRSIAQAPIMNPIVGSHQVCSSPATPTGFSASASNSPSSYNWIVSPATGVTIGTPNLANTTISFPHTNGTFTVYCTATNGSGTSAPVQFTVSVFETPTVTFSGANSFCQGSSTNLQASSTILAASSTISYNWSPNTGLNTSTGPVVNASPAANTIYSVTGTIGLCSSTSTILITVNQTPTINASTSPSVICTGNLSTLTISGNATSYSLNSVSTPTSIVISPTTTTIYTITGITGQGCMTTQNYMQTVLTCVGIKENEMANTRLLVYPNPSNGQFVIRSTVYQAGKITNEMGQVIKEIEIYPDSETKITGLKSGIYFIITATTRTKLIVIE